MVRYEDECCGCAAPGYPCIGDRCPRRHVPHYYCDECGKEIDEGMDLCDRCKNEDRKSHARTNESAFRNAFPECQSRRSGQRRIQHMHK